MEKEEVIGNWRLTKEASRLLKSEGAKSEDGLITKFQLKTNSSAIVFFSNPENGQELTGTWERNAGKQLGNKNFAITIKSDVLITFERTKNTIYKVGLRLDKKNN